MGVLKVKGVPKLAALASGEAFKQFMESWEGVGEFILHIVDYQ